ncbi:MAG: TetR/AcrR family transcriptional regulator [Gemmatimonadaceae bacterium]|nr:TetR/AcrR family transcriptional regulator [Gemmatimonadaceae bacterium]MCW5825676.1 TetR/AcrR family transcriptional regulator [Gemmatimonadaceae bacterium]
MSPRPRKISDDQVFEALTRVMQRVPAASLTLAEVGAEAGVTASALSQRFGSKQALLRALNARFAEGTPELLESIRERHASPVAAIRAWAEGFAWLIATPSSLAHHLGYLQMDLSDEVMFTHLQKATRATRRTLAQWVAEAVQAGELQPGTDPAALARLLLATANGSMMTYALLRQGKPVEWIRADVELALGPFRVPAR